MVPSAFVDTTDTTERLAPSDSLGRDRGVQPIQFPDSSGTFEGCRKPVASDEFLPVQEQTERSYDT